MALVFETALALFLTYTPGMSSVFQTSPLQWQHFGFPAIAFSLLIFVYDESRRYLMRKYRRKHNKAVGALCVRVFACLFVCLCGSWEEGKRGMMKEVGKGLKAIIVNLFLDTYSVQFEPLLNNGDLFFQAGFSARLTGRFLHASLPSDQLQGSPGPAPRLPAHPPPTAGAVVYVPALSPALFRFFRPGGFFFFFFCSNLSVFFLCRVRCWFALCLPCWRSPVQSKHQK